MVLINNNKNVPLFELFVIPRFDPVCTLQKNNYLFLIMHLSSDSKGCNKGGGARW